MNLSLGLSSVIGSSSSKITSTFLDVLGVKGDEIFKGGNLIVVQENGDVDGSFVLQILMAEFSRLASSVSCKTQMRGLLVLNSQTEQHWKSIASKLGWNTNLMKEKGQLALIDILKDTYEEITNLIDEDKNCRISESPSQDSIAGEDSCQETTAVHSTDLYLKKLLSQCSAEIQRICENSSASLNSNFEDKDDTLQLFIIIENLSNIFYSSDESERNVLEFLKELRFLNPGRANVCVGTLVNSNENDLRGSYFAKTLSHLMSTVAFQISPLQTGFSAQVDGSISVEKYDRKIILDKSQIETLIRTKAKVFHYKLEDRGVKIVYL